MSEIRLNGDHCILNSNYLLRVCNEITLIHNQIVNGEMFSAGFNLCSLQQILVEHMRKLEKVEAKDFYDYCSNPRND